MNNVLALQKLSMDCVDMLQAGSLASAVCTMFAR